MRAQLASYAVGLCIVACPAAALASPPETPAALSSLHDVLELEPGTTCLDFDRLLVQVTEFRGSSEVDGRLGLVVVGDAERADLVRFEVRWSGKTVAERLFDPAPESCDDVHAVVGVALAIAIDDQALAQAIARTEEELEPEPEPQPQPEPEPEPQPEPAPGPELETGAVVQPTPVPKVRLAMGLDGLVLVGVIPQVSGGAAVGVEVGPHPVVDIRLAGVTSFGIDRQFAGGLLDFGLGGGEVDLCAGGPDRWRFRPRGCAGFLAAAIRWVGRGFDQSQAGVAPWVAVTASAELRFALSPRIGVQLSVKGAFPIVQSEYVFVGIEEERRLKPPPVSGFVSLGPVFRIL